MRGRLERCISRRPAGRSASRTTSPRLSLLRARPVARLLRRAELDGASGLLQERGSRLGELRLGLVQAPPRMVEQRSTFRAMNVRQEQVVENTDVRARGSSTDFEYELQHMANAGRSRA